jgi:hypothetical protein
MPPIRWASRSFWRSRISRLASRTTPTKPGSPPFRSASAETSIQAGKRSPFLRWKVSS